ncbi:Uncharacterised protein [Vibrio cholerae]|uniref:Uncharacterized protein n=1 Tax=Vibrio cholerae TaxID=666 RepID=A0A656AVD6_VIBCL|nr:Uncharacterised protein [Vibrio cholerae]
MQYSYQMVHYNEHFHKLARHRRLYLSHVHSTCGSNHVKCREKSASELLEGNSL